MDLETAIQRLTAQAIRTHGFRLPIYVASVAANGAVLFTRFEPPPVGSAPGSATSEHVTGDVGDEGFEAPIHLMAKDSAGRIRLARLTLTGDLLPIEIATSDDEDG